MHSTKRGLDRFEADTGTFTHYLADPDSPPGSPSHYVARIDESPAGEFWIGTSGGLYPFDREHERWGTPYRHDPGDPHGPSEGRLFTSLLDREGRLWIGRFGGGLDRFDPDQGSFYHYQNDPENPHSLGNNIVASIVEGQDGTLWIGNNGGVDRLVLSAVTQSLYSLTLLAEAGQRMIAANSGAPELASNQSRLGDISQQALQEMRLLVYELRPLALESEGLVGALEQRLETVERRAGVGASLVVQGEAELAADVEEALYRIAQEALNNALKHGKPSSVTVTLRLEDPIELEVADDGAGFDPSSTDGAGGIGLSSMRERAVKAGGALTIHSTPGKGTRIQVIVG